MTQRLPFLILLMILVFGAYIRYWFSDGVPMWHDEAFSVHLSHLPWKELVQGTALDVHPPLYYLVLKAWQIPFGTTVDALRSLSLVFGVGSIWAGYLVAKTAFRHSPLALSAALLIAVNPFQVAYAGEVRMYTMGVFLALMALYFLLRVLGRSRHHDTLLTTIFLYFGLVLTMSAAIYTHYYLLFTVALFLIAGLLFEISHLRFRIHAYFPYLTGATLVVLSYAPWAPTLLEQISQVRSGYWIRDIGWMSVPGSFWNILLGIPMSVQNLGTEVLEPHATLNTYLGMELVSKWHGEQVLLVLIALCALCIIAFTFRKGGHAGKLLALGTLAPFIGGLGYSLFAHYTGSNSSIYFDRYFIFAGGTGMILIAWASFQLRHRWITYLLLALYVSGAVYGVFEYHKGLHPSNSPGMRAVMEFIQERPNLPVVIASPLQYANAIYYAQEESPELPLRMQIWAPDDIGRKQIPHTYATTIIPNSQVLTSWKEVPSSRTVIVVWSDGFGASEPTVPSSWNRIDRKIIRDVRPPGTHLYVDTYLPLMK